MAGSIKFLQFVKKFNQLCGIYACESIQVQRSVISTKTLFLIGFAQFIFSTAAFLVFGAKSIFDYGYAFYMLFVVINGFVIYVIFIWQSVNTLKFIENCERFIEKSKCCPKHSKLCHELCRNSRCEIHQSTSTWTPDTNNYKMIKMSCVFDRGSINASDAPIWRIGGKNWTV